MKDASYWKLGRNAPPIRGLFGGAMSSEREVISAVINGAFEDAVSMWTDLAFAEGSAISGDVLTWDFHGQTLEARLIYLSMLSRYDLIEEALKKFRSWMLEQKSSVISWPELGEAPFSLPDNMRVGHSEIDRDHENLFRHANEVRDALRQGDTKRAEKMAGRLINEILDHFDREEEILKRTGYPDAECHGRYHSQLRGKARELLDVLHTLGQGGAGSLITYDALLKFLVNDPISADMDFKPFFAAQAHTSQG